jgi:uncharacterized membrane protein
MRWLLALIYAIAGIVHLTAPTVFLPVMPGWVPAPYQVVLFTGLCEFAGAVGLVIPRTRRLAGAMLALYAICVFPANIKHALDGPPVFGMADSWLYHGPRLLFQPVLVWWALYAGGITDWPFLRRRAHLQ